MTDAEDIRQETLISQLNRGINMTPYLNTTQVCVRLGCSKQTLWRMVRERRFPVPTIEGRPHKWLVSVVERYETMLGTESLESLRVPRISNFLREQAGLVDARLGGEHG